MNDVLNHLEKAIDEMTEAAGVLIDLASHGDETALNYIEIFTSVYTEMMAMYGLMYAENEKSATSTCSEFNSTAHGNPPSNFKGL